MVAALLMQNTLFGVNLLTALCCSVFLKLVLMVYFDFSFRIQRITLPVIPFSLVILEKLLLKRNCGASSACKNRRQYRCPLCAVVLHGLVLESRYNNSNWLLFIFLSVNLVINKWRCCAKTGTLFVSLSSR